MQGFKKVRNQ